MNPKIAAGAALALSNPIINTTASVIGVAKTGAAIGTLHGAAHTSATAAWVGLGSMKVGMFMMGALPVVGALLIIDGLCGRDHGSPIIDWYEEAWRLYEAECELEEMKKAIQVDQPYQMGTKPTAASLAQLNAQFVALEIEHELFLMKQEFGLV